MSYASITLVTEGSAIPRQEWGSPWSCSGFALLVWVLRGPVINDRGPWVRLNNRSALYLQAFDHDPCISLRWLKSQPPLGIVELHVLINILNDFRKMLTWYREAVLFFTFPQWVSLVPHKVRDLMKTPGRAEFPKTEINSTAAVGFSCPWSISSWKLLKCKFKFKIVPLNWKGYRSEELFYSPFKVPFSLGLQIIFLKKDSY